MKLINYLFFSLLFLSSAVPLKADAAGKIAMLAGGSLAVGSSVAWIKMEQKLMNAQKEKQESLGDFFRYAGSVGGIKAGKYIASIVGVAGVGLFLSGACRS